MLQDAWHTSLKQASLPTDLTVTWAERQVPVANNGIQKRLEQAGHSLMKGYHTALTADNFDAIVTELDQLDGELRGFAYEGVGMGLAQQTFISRREGHSDQSDRIATFTNGPGVDYHNMVYVGLGLMLARLQRPISDQLAQLPTNKLWLILDGYGYYHGMFHWRSALDQQAPPENIDGYLQQVFDQGLGRSIWFVDGGDAPHIVDTINQFPQARQADLWGGVGYACAYAGGVDVEAISALGEQADNHRSQLAQGIGLAAYSRQKLGNQSVHTERACQTIWGLDADTVVDRLTTAGAPNTDPGDTSNPADWQHYRAYSLVPAGV